MSETFEKISKVLDGHEVVPRAGVGLKCWNCKAAFTLSERANCDGCCWKCGKEIELDDYVATLQAENAALQQRLNVADQRNDELTAVLNQVWDQAGVLPGHLARLIAGVV